MNCRTSWQATLGRTPAGAQHGLGRFVRPNRASSANITRKGRPLAAAMRRAFVTVWRNLFYKLLAPPHPAQDETEAASTCASDGGPRHCRSYCRSSDARSPPRRLVPVRAACQRSAAISYCSPRSVTPRAERCHRAPRRSPARRGTSPHHPAI
jgi:hypothetical protein